MISTEHIEKSEVKWYWHIMTVPLSLMRKQALMLFICPCELMTVTHINFILSLRRLETALNSMKHNDDSSQKEHWDEYADLLLIIEADYDDNQHMVKWRWWLIGAGHIIKYVWNAMIIMPREASLNILMKEKYSGLRGIYRRFTKWGEQYRWHSRPALWNMAVAMMAANIKPASSTRKAHSVRQLMKIWSILKRYKAPALQDLGMLSFRHGR